MKKTISINLYAGPGTGKSTTAAFIFYKLKKLHYNVEIVMEYAKDLTYEKSYSVLENQIHIFGNQQHRMYRHKKEVDIIVCDSPLLLGLQYANNSLKEYLEPLVMYEYNQYNNIDIFLERKTQYTEIGRNQTLDEAIIIDNNILNILDKSNIFYVKMNPINNEENILKYIIEKINLYNN